MKLNANKSKTRTWTGTEGRYNGALGTESVNEKVREIIGNFQFIIVMGGQFFF